VGLAVHGPPAVACRFSRSPQPALLLAVVACLTLFTLGCLVSSTSQWTWMVLALLALYLNAQAWFQWWQSVQGDLQWDGDQWHWSSWTLSPACSVDWVYDFQTWGLVRIENEKRQSQWLWLHKGATDDAQWQAIRRALLATRGHAQGANRHNATSASY
jgi:hypothetical protein